MAVAGGPIDPSQNRLSQSSSSSSLSNGSSAEVSKKGCTNERDE